MHVKSIKLTKFRNYENDTVNFQAGKNIVIGDNAQGKTNLLEAVDILSNGKSSRCQDDKELVCWGHKQASLELVYRARNYDETLSIDWILKEPSTRGKLSGRCQKVIKVNGLSQPTVKGLLGRLVTVSFSADDMKILRSGPRYRRDWLDSIAVRLRPNFHDVIYAQQKSLAQRNKLLKVLAEKGKVTVQDQDELLVWDKQIAKYGTQIIKMRLKLLAQILPIAESHQSTLSNKSESLSIDYVFAGKQDSSNEFSGGEDDDSSQNESPAKSMDEIEKMPEAELAHFLMKLMKERRWLELRRRQTLVGPHRDNLLFKLDNADASTYASQGQQRSIVLSLKLAELKMVSQEISETPVLLLDDVLSELDEKRAALLLSAVSGQMQTIMSTTHLSAIDPFWLEGANVMSVSQGSLCSLAGSGI